MLALAAVALDELDLALDWRPAGSRRPSRRARRARRAGGGTRCSRPGTRSAGGRAAPTRGRRSRRGTRGRARPRGAPRSGGARCSSSHSIAPMSRWFVGSSSMQQVRVGDDAAGRAPRASAGRPTARSAGATTRRGRSRARTAPRRRAGPACSRRGRRTGAGGPRRSEPAGVALVLELARARRPSARGARPRGGSRAQVGRGHEPLVEVRLLAQQPDRQPPPPSDRAPVRLVPPGHDPKQRRLAGAVRPRPGRPARRGRSRPSIRSRMTNVPISRTTPSRRTSDTVLPRLPVCGGLTSGPACPNGQPLRTIASCDARPAGGHSGQPASPQHGDQGCHRSGRDGSHGQVLVRHGPRTATLTLLAHAWSTAPT